MTKITTTLKNLLQTKKLNYHSFFMPFTKLKLESGKEVCQGGYYPPNVEVPAKPTESDILYYQAYYEVSEKGRFRRVELSPAELKEYRKRFALTLSIAKF